ncbi:MAG: hypothetical protein IPK72_17085 [Candidatus Eisenbacteria bacterium]|nr:hypothetical protein [Candidatus Eisenbacteria bacterium]
MNSLLRAAPAWITGYGVTTALGGTTAQSVAALRGGLVRFLQSERYSCAPRDPKNQEPEPAMTAAIEELDPELSGVERLLALSFPALREAIAAAALKRADLSAYTLCVSLPQRSRPGEPELEARFVQELIRRSGLGKPSTTFVSRAGHSGVAECFAAVLRAPEPGLTLVVAADSLVEPQTLAWYDQLDRLKCARAPEGLIPGEAAAGFVLEPPRLAERRGAEPRGTLDAVGLAEEKAVIASDLACTGVGMCEAVRSALAGLAKAPSPPWIVLDQTGERYRGLEWSYVLSRLHQVFGEARPTWYLADCVGDTGAAVGGVAAARLLGAFERNYAPGEQGWVILSSDEGGRGAFVLGSPKRGF